MNICNEVNKRRQHNHYHHHHHHHHHCCCCCCCVTSKLNTDNLCGACIMDGPYWQIAALYALSLSLSLSLCNASRKDKHLAAYKTPCDQLFRSTNLIIIRVINCVNCYSFFSNPTVFIRSIEIEAYLLYLQCIYSGQRTTVIEL